MGVNWLGENPFKKIPERFPNGVCGTVAVGFGPVVQALASRSNGPGIRKGKNQVRQTYATQGTVAWRFVGFQDACKGKPFFTRSVPHFLIVFNSGKGKANFDKEGTTIDKEGTNVEKEGTDVGKEGMDVGAQPVPAEKPDVAVPERS